MKIKIGIDFGKTIGVVEKNEPYPNSFKTINYLTNFYGNENIFIISKAREKMKKKIINWLNIKEFTKTTNFLEKNIYFCDNYEDKAKLVEKYKINVFIDDHIKVIRVISVLPQMIKIIWFNENTNIKEIEKKYRQKIVIIKEWNKIMKTFYKINKKHKILCLNKQ